MQSPQGTFFPDVPIAAAMNRPTDRYAEREWTGADQPPTQPMWTVVRQSADPAAVNRRVLYSGRQWLTIEPVGQWKEGPAPENMVTGLLERPEGVSPIEGLEVLELGQIDQADERKVLAQLARMELEVEVVRMYRPGANAQGATSGQVLAVSENYAAQSMGDDGVLIVEQQRLSRRVEAGENVTLAFQGGRAEVFDGMLFDVNVRAPFLDREQVGWLRRVMIQALSQTRDAAAHDDVIKEALRYALSETINAYGLDRTLLPLTQVTLAVRDSMTLAQGEAMRKADENAQDDDDRTIRRLLSAPGRA